MTIDTSLRGSDGQKLRTQVVETYALNGQKTDVALQALAEEVKVRIQRAMLSRGGVADVASLVTNPTSADTLDSAALPLAAIQNGGNGILDVLIGSKHISRGIAGRAARLSGLPASTTEKLLPAVASLLVEQMQRQAKPALNSLVRQSPALFGATGDPAGGPGGASRKPPPTQIDAGPPPPIPGDNIPGIGKSAPRRGQPETDNPFNRLPDIVRRGGAPAPGGGSLEDVIRSIFGKVLGSNRGVIGTMIQIFLVRWLASLARRILSRATGR